ncbi:MAG: HD-GYP domain-containing protein, partial [Deltaproteobacteria bacterium]
RNALIRYRRALEGAISALATAIEKRDPYTAGHQRRVAEIARAIAREMRLPEDKVQCTYMAALLHDIGKISIPAEVLSKPGRLNEPEYQMIKFHPIVGYEILKDIDFPWPIAKVILYHHERIDGSGYPEGLKDGEIPLESRILAVADVVEAISSHRPYRPALGIDVALEEIEKNKGKLYEPEVVDACVRLFKEGRFRLKEQG